jgi:hypothetical protein
MTAAAKWLEGYSGQTVEQLIALADEYRLDSLVLAFEEALTRKAGRAGIQSLTDAERTILAIEALEREVNNGGYSQFFINESRGHAATVVESLHRIGCPATAEITRRALAALGPADISAEGISRAMAAENQQRDENLEQCDDAFYDAEEDIAARLFAFIKSNESAIKL